jgi:ribosomal protein L12E/L44/L45/RPP1/RPP2
LGGRGRRISEFEASLLYTVSSRTARATKRNPDQKKKKKKKEEEEEEEEEEEDDFLRD